MTKGKGILGERKAGLVELVDRWSGTWTWLTIEGGGCSDGCKIERTARDLGGDQSATRPYFKTEARALERLLNVPSGEL
jgi:hypothetical protein